jgi:hypothetical protein
MRRIISAAATALVLSFAGAAFAGPITATLASPPASQGQVIAASAVWTCTGATCVSHLAPDASEGVSGCRALAKQVGPLASYSGERKSLDAAALAKCNAGLSAAGLTTASR